MQSLSSYVQSAKGAILILGTPGAGKTILCSQFPNVYILECDNNLKGPADFISKQGLSKEMRFDIPHIKDGVEVPRADRYGAAADLLHAAMKDPSIDTIVIDSLTTFVDFVLDEIRRQEKRKIASALKKGEADDVMRIQDWGTFSGMLKQVIITLKASGKRIVFTGHIEHREDEQSESSKTLYKYIACPGSLRETISGYFDEVWLITQELAANKLDYKRVLNTSPPDFRAAALGLKTAVGLGRKWDLDFKKLNEALS